MTRNRSLALVALLVALSTACAGRGRPPVIVPDPPVCEGRNVDILVYNDDASPRPMAGVVVSSDGQADRTTNPDGHVHFWACGSAPYRFTAANWHTLNCGDLGAACDLAGGNEPHRVHLTRITPDPDPPPPPPSVKANPVNGAIWVDRAAHAAGDDTGYRTFVELHAGDTPLRWGAGGVAEVEADADEWARADYDIVRMWSHINADGGVWSRGGSPPYNGFDVLRDPQAEDKLVGLVNAIAARGMRATLEAGGINDLTTAQELAVMDLFNRVGQRAGWWKIAWVAPVNEPSSTHATSDDNGDVEPSHLQMLVDRLRAGADVLWHLGYGSNVDWDSGNRFSQKRLTPSHQRFGYYHAYRGQDLTAKVRHRLSWLIEHAGQYVGFWVDGEGVGQSCERGQPLRYVSVTDRCEQLDAEALSLIVGVQTLRGIGSQMSGNGVQRHHPWTEVVGWRQVPWTVRQMPKDVATFSTLVHGGRPNAVFKATSQGSAILRVEQAISGDGRIAAIAHSSEEWKSWDVPVSQDVRVQVCDTGAMACTPEMDVDAGGRVPLGLIRHGRLITGRLR